MLFDPADPEFLADPYPVFAALRAGGEVQWHDGLNLPVALSHAACSEVLRDRSAGRVWQDKEPTDAYAAVNLLHQNSLLENEPPRHTRLRRLVSAAFARGHTARLAQRVQALAQCHLACQAARVLAGGTHIRMVAGPSWRVPA